MASEKYLKGRFQQKIDDSENWEKASNFKPLNGEIIIYRDLKKLKVGDGEKTVGELEFYTGDISEEILEDYAKKEDLDGFVDDGELNKALSSYLKKSDLPIKKSTSYSMGLLFNDTGNNEAGDGGSAFGSNAHATGQYSVAEGKDTYATGARAHAEGGGTTAQGTRSHAEGWGTIAAGQDSHVQGSYNLEDKTVTSSNKRGTYAHIVGNGDNTKRSNAHTLDWDGNAWFKGDIKIGGTSYNDKNADRLVKSSELNSKLDKTGGNLTGHLGVNNKYELGSVYNYTNGCLIDIGPSGQNTMCAIHITGNSFDYNSAMPINSMFQFYDYANGGIINSSGINWGKPLGDMTVYRYDGRLYAYISQTADYQTLSFTLITNRSGLAPKISNSVAHTSDFTDLTIITPKNTYTPDEIDVKLDEITTKISSTTDEIDAKLDEITTKISLTGQIQTGAYRTSVIALCKAPLGDKDNLNSYSSGRLTFQRTNGLYAPCMIDITMAAAHGGIDKVKTRFMRYGNFITFKPCTFTYNNTTYGGIAIKIMDAAFSEVDFIGVTTFDIFGLDFYEQKDGVITVLDQEVYDSINYDTPEIAGDDDDDSGVLYGKHRVITSKNIANHYQPGIIKAQSSTNAIKGIYITQENDLAIKQADENEINAKENTYKPIVPSNLDLAIKAGLTNNKLSWDDTEKSNARDLIGAVSQKYVEDEISKIEISGGGGVSNLPLQSSSSLDFTNLIINDGTTNAKYSIAGGSADESTIKGIVGDTVANLVKDDMAKSQANGIMSMSYGTSNIAHSSASNAFGIKNQGGFLGYYITDISDKTLTLSSSQTETIKPQKEILGQWQSGWKVTIINGELYPLCAEIESVNTTDGTVTFTKALPFDTIIESPKIYGISQEAPHDRSIIAIPTISQQEIKVEVLGVLVGTGKYVNTYRPAAIGEVQLGFSATTFGFDNIAAGTLSTAIGYRNTALGTAAFVTGRENTGAFASLVGGYNNTVTGGAAFASGRDNIASGSYASAEGSYNEATGNNAHAEGNETTASDVNAHAEGYMTVASAAAAHAEGNQTNASGKRSHAEGLSTKASGLQSHAEGNKTVASGESAHAEGEGTQALAAGAHAEGKETIANRGYSHVEGLGTVASSAYQHVEGKFNIKDIKVDNNGSPILDNNGKEQSGDKYIHIVGNGSSDEKRSNAHTLDWSGNAWFKGNIKINGTGYDDEDAKAIATEPFVKGAIEEAIANLGGGDYISRDEFNAFVSQVNTALEKIITAQNNYLGIEEATVNE